MQQSVDTGHTHWAVSHNSARLRPFPQVTLKRVGDRGNASDMQSQWFYRWLQATWPWHVVGQFAALFALGGLPAMVWGGALRMVWVYHITWFVNSASHVWGYQTFNTGDLSRNNWWERGSADIVHYWGGEGGTVAAARSITLAAVLTVHLLSAPFPNI